MKVEEEEDEDCFFIVPRRKKVTAVRHIKKEEGSCGGTRIIDEKISRKSSPKKEEDDAESELGGTPDIEFVYAESRVALERKRECALMSAVWAIQMYMEPLNVMHCCVYWISQYVNYRDPEAEWFNGFIRGLMHYPVRLSLSACQGIAHLESKQTKYTLLMHVAGSTLHKIPDEYFAQKDCVQLMEGICNLIEPAEQCFLTNHTFELKGEIESSTFQYNRILSYFYEPSFLIITSYMLYIHYLLSLARAGNTVCSSSTFLPFIKNIMKPIRHKNVAWDLLLSLNKLNSNYKEKRRVFEQDLADLYQALDHADIDTIRDEVLALWSRKATYVTDLIPDRFQAIYTQLYG